MKRISTKSITVSVAISIIILVLAGAAILQASTPEEAPGVPVVGMSVFEPFFRMPLEQEEALKNIVINDPEIKNLLEMTEYDYEVQVGARLISGLSPETSIEWLQLGQTDTSIIREYTGLLFIGYNDTYTFTINLEKKTVESFEKKPNNSPTIPELTRFDKEKALTIVNTDSLIQSLLLGKGFEIAPERRIGVWHSESNAMLGVVLEIWFDGAYEIEADLPVFDYDETKYAFPHFVDKVAQFSGTASKLAVVVSFSSNKIIGVYAL